MFHPAFASCVSIYFWFLVYYFFKKRNDRISSIYILSLQLLLVNSIIFSFDLIDDSAFLIFSFKRLTNIFSFQLVLPAHLLLETFAVLLYDCISVQTIWKSNVYSQSEGYCFPRFYVYGALYWLLPLVIRMTSAIFIWTPGLTLGVDLFVNLFSFCIT